MVTGTAVALALAVGAQDVREPTSMNSGPRFGSARVGVEAAVADTGRVRRRAVRLSEAYHTRFRIHKTASLAMIPLFAAQFAAGDQLFTKGDGAPSWARNSHKVLAGGVAGLFVLNSVTGGLNWWETRRQQPGRKWRTAHAALMLVAEAGFTSTGLLADDAKESFDDRRRHRALALSSMGVATASYLMMLKPLRRD